MIDFKIAAFSDTHNQHKLVKLPDPDYIDILVFAGDATSRGSLEETIKFVKWFGSLPHKHKILVPGNHDWLFEKDPGLTKKICDDAGVTLLNDSGVTIEGIKFWGSPVTPWFMDWAFNRARNENESILRRVPLISEHWDKIPNDTEVLITHGPAYEKLDELKMPNGEPYPLPRHAGCKDLKNAIERVKPDIHICGHIHSGHGEIHKNGTSYYNVAILDDMYCAVNQPKIIEMYKEK